MAKMFYSLNETATKLGMSPDEVQDLARSGQLEEFRDDDNNLVFKVSQVDLLSGGAGGGDTGAPIALADSGELDPIGLESSGSRYAVDAREGSAGASGAGESGMGLGDSRDRTGVSIFETDDVDTADPSAQTQVTNDVTAPDFNMDAAASGSGLYDLGGSGGGGLGGDLLEDVYGSEETGSTAGVGPGDSGVAAPGALFETTGGATEPASPVAVAAAEPYDGAWSGIAGGFALGAVVALVIAAGVAILGISGSGVAGILEPLGASAIFILAGAALAVALIGAVVGWLLLRNS